jgi:hypothetical protein
MIEAALAAGNMKKPSNKGESLTQKDDFLEVFFIAQVWWVSIKNDVKQYFR